MFLFLVFALTWSVPFREVGAEAPGDEFGGRDRKAVLQLLDEDLRDGDLPVRVETAGRLARLGGDDALEVLARGLKSPYGVVRSAVVEALGVLKVRGAIPHLVSALGDPEHWVRSAAAAVLGEAGDSSAVAALEALYADPVFLVRRNAAITVHRLGTASGRSKLIEWLDDPDWRVRVVLAGDLARLGLGDAVLPLRKHLADPDWRVQIAAAQAAADLRDTGAIPEIAALARNENCWVARTAVHALRSLGEEATVRRYVMDADKRVGQLASPEAIEAFLQGLPGCGKWVLRQAEIGLGLGNDRSVLPGLMARMDGAHAYQRRDAARRLGAIGDPAAASPLFAGLTGKDESTQLECFASLACVGKPAGPGHAARILEGHPDGPVRQRTLHLLGQSGDPKALDVVRPSLSDPDPWVRHAASEACRQLCPDEWDILAVDSVVERTGGLEGAVPDELRLAASSGQHLRDSLRHRVSTQRGIPRLVSVLALAAANDSSGWRAAVEELSGETQEIRITAAIVLGIVGDVAAVPAIVEAMKSDDPWTMSSLRASLRRMGDQAVPGLIDLLNHAEEPIRARAHAAIEEITFTRVPFNPKEPNPKAREAWIATFRTWWADYTFLRGLGYATISDFQKAHTLAITGDLDAGTRARLEELRLRK